MSIQLDQYKLILQSSVGFPKSQDLRRILSISAIIRMIEWIRNSFSPRSRDMPFAAAQQLQAHAGHRTPRECKADAGWLSSAFTKTAASGKKGRGDPAQSSIAAEIMIAELNATRGGVSRMAGVSDLSRLLMPR